MPASRDQHAIWWQVYPLGFLGAGTGAGGAAGRPLESLGDWLGYAADLGVSGLALGPVFASSTHGYDTVDYFRVDPRIGGDGSLDRLIEAAGRRGLQVLLDGVFNHVGAQYPQFLRTVAGQATPDEADWFVPLAGQPGAYRTFEGHSGLIALNHDSPAVADFVVSVMTHWLGRGAGGWRLDAAYAVPRPFWASVLPRVRARYPDAYVVGEVIHGDYSGFVREAGVDAVTQYELWKAIWSSLNDANLFELAWALKRHGELLADFAPLTFVGNHDVTRIASRLADERHLGHALAVLFTVGGTPSVYYGDEQGFRGIKEDRAGGDDEIRPAFPAAGPDGLAPFGWPVYRLHQQLIGFRRRHPWLHRAAASVLTLTNTFLAYECAGADGRVLVALNLGDAPRAAAAPGTRRELVGAPGAAADGGVLTVPAHGWAVYSTT